MGKILFHYPGKKIRIKNITEVKTIILRIFEETKKNIIRIDYIICDDEYMLALNKEYLLHDAYTDILTFPGLKNSSGVMGEVYISYDRIKENAGKYRTSLNSEFHRVIFHGVLHLCGFDDMTKTQRKKMTNLENLYLIKLKRIVSRET